MSEYDEGPRLEAADYRRERLFIVGGILFLAITAIFILLIVLAIVLLSSLGFLTSTSPVTVTDLTSLANDALLAKANFGLGILSDLVLLPAGVVLCLVITKTNKIAALLAASFLCLYVILDLISGFSYLSLVAISQSYVSGTVGTQHSLVSAGSIMNLTRLTIPIGSGVLSVGILIASLNMPRPVFGRTVTFLGISSGIVGIAYGCSVLAPGLEAFYGISALLETVWFMRVGYKFSRPSHSSTC